MDDDQDLVDTLIGASIAKRYKQYMPRCSETEWFAVAMAAREIAMVLSRKTGDPLDAIDEFFALEEAMQ